MEKLRIVFMGTPHFALPSLQALLDRRDQIVGVVTQPDRPVGRGQQILPPPVKERALKSGLTVYQPLGVRDEPFVTQLQALAPDLIVVVAFGQILPAAVLTIPRCGCINVHASLLPQYRGAAPINWALINGERSTGVTIMLLDAGMDTGDILLQEPVAILPADTAASLHDRLALHGASLLDRALDQLKTGAWQPVPQDHTQASYAPLLKKADGCIRWDKSAREISQQIRGMTPWPGCFTYFNGKVLKIYRSEVCEGTIQAVPGKILSVSEEAIEVATGNGSLLLKELQLEGKKKLTVAEFIKGHAVKPGAELRSENQ